MGTTWRRTSAATGLWVRAGRGRAVAAPLVFARYLLDPRAAVRALSDARHRP